MKLNKSGLLIYKDQREVFEMLSGDDCKELMLAIFDFADGNERILSPIVSMAFIPVKKQLLRDNENYLKTCEKNRNNINKRWRDVKAKDTTVFDGIRMNTKHTDKDKDMDKDIKRIKIERAEQQIREAFEREGEVLA